MLHMKCFVKHQVLGFQVSGFSVQVLAFSFLSPDTRHLTPETPSNCRPTGHFP
jgi:hypothetical protein